MNFQCLSFQFRKCETKVKEKFVLGDNDFVLVYRGIIEWLGISELLILTTCNRTEFYFFSNDNQIHDLLNYFKVVRKISEQDIEHCDYRLLTDQEETLKHLCEVSLGVHSQVLGDVQVINQLKDAYRKAVDLGGARLYLHKVMHRVFALNKYVTTHTEFKKGVSSVSSAAVQLVRSVSKKKTNPILLIGSGESSEETLKNLLNSGYSNITIVNRTFEKAIDLANKHCVSYESFNRLKDLITSSSVILSSLSTSEKIINTTNVPMELSTYQYRYFLDLSVLGVVDTHIEKNPENLVYDISYMTERNEETKALRRMELKRVNEMILSEITSYKEWLLETTLLNRFKDLHTELSQFTKEEFGSKFTEEVKKFNGLVSKEAILSTFSKLSLVCQKEDPEFFTKHELNSIFNVEYIKQII